MYIRPARLVKAIALTAAGVAALWIFPRLMPWVSPFIIAFAIAAAMEPAVRFLYEKLRLPRSAASGIMTALIFGGAGFLLLLLGGRGVIELGELALKAPEILTGFFSAMDGMLNSLREYLSTLPGEAGLYSAALLDSLPQQAARFVGEVSGRVISSVSSLAGKMPRILFFSATTGLGVYFVSSEYPAIIKFLNFQMPSRWRAGAEIVRADFLSSIEKWIRAQLILAVITFAELFIALVILRIPYAIIIAALAAVADFLPVVGAGTVLIPWALGAALTGNYQLGAALAVIYGVVSLLRSLFQARLIGDQIGLHPVISLAAVYIGFCAMGVWGMILLPILAIMVKQLNDRGILKMWRKPG